MKNFNVYLAALCILISVAACEQTDTLPTSALVGTDHPTEPGAILSKKASRTPVLDPESARIAAFVDEINAKLAAGGSELRLDYPWLFRVGPGTDPFAQLRTGSRWTKSAVEYVLDESDYTSDLNASELEVALERSFESWNEIARTYIDASRAPDDVGDNPDFLDGTIIQVPGESGLIDVCATVLDVTSATLVEITPSGGLILNQPTDILVGGWLDEKYFELCLGSTSILAVTWFLSGGDQNGDGYADLGYVEQFYNEGFDWTTAGSTFLGNDIDLESVAVHENGHALGLGHFGGPVRNQPLTLKPNGRIFNPEAVMNPGYFGGEKRMPLPTDVAGLTTLYSGHVSTTAF